LADTQIKMKSQQVGRLIRIAITEAEKPGGGRYFQNEVAEAIGKTDDHLSRALAGKAHLRLEDLARIANLLNVSFRLELPDGEVTVGNMQTASRHYDQIITDNR